MIHLRRRPALLAAVPLTVTALLTAADPTLAAGPVGTPDVGDRAFFRVLRAWATAHRDGNATNTQSERLAEKVSGNDLGSLFETWPYVQGKPNQPNQPNQP